MHNALEAQCLVVKVVSRISELLDQCLLSKLIFGFDKSPNQIWAQHSIITVFFCGWVSFSYELRNSKKLTKNKSAVTCNTMVQNGIFFLLFLFSSDYLASNIPTPISQFCSYLMLNNTFSLVVSLSSIPFRKDLKFCGVRAEFSCRNVWSFLSKMRKQQQMKKRLDIRCRKNNYLLACSKLMCS